MGKQLKMYVLVDCTGTIRPNSNGRYTWTSQSTANDWAVKGQIATGDVFTVREADLILRPILHEKLEEGAYRGKPTWLEKRSGI